MTRRNEFAELIVEILDRSGCTPVHIQLLYEQISHIRPDLTDDEPDPHAPKRLKWQHDIRWELQTAVTNRRISKRSDVGRGFYSGLASMPVKSPESHSVTLGPIESSRVEPVELRSTGASRQAWREEGLLVSRYALWARDRGPAIARLEIRTPEGDRLAADAFDPDRHLLIAAKATAARSSMRMAVGQLLDYAQSLPRGTELAVLIPGVLQPSVERFLTGCEVGTIVEATPGNFVEQLRRTARR